MENIKVKITKKGSDGCWYNNKIGLSFIVQTEMTEWGGFPAYKLVNTGTLILKKHCEIVKREPEIVKDFDFQIGDKAYCLMLGNGMVSFDDDGSDATAICVTFPNEVITWYNSKGALENISGPDGDTEFEKDSTKRTLFHGHDLEVKVNEKEPVRYLWANVFVFDKNGENCLQVHNTKKDCENDINNYLDTNECHYVTTIQLIPNNLKEK